MTVFGWDASDFDWDRGPMDLAAARRDGIDFFTHKATENTNVVHGRYAEAMRRARDAGISVLGAYHVVRSPRNARAEVDYFLAYVDRHTPWWRDWPAWFWQVDLEKWPYDAVPADEGEAFADIIERLTGRRAIIYASRGQYGDALTGTSHALWNANYGSNAAGPYRTVYQLLGGDRGPGWGSYSGRVPDLWQFGSRTVIGSQHTCDANAYRGTLAQLIHLIGGKDPDMDLEDKIVSPGGYRADDSRFDGPLKTSVGNALVASQWYATAAYEDAHAALALVRQVAATLNAVAEKIGFTPAQVAEIAAAAREGAREGVEDEAEEAVAEALHKAADSVDD